MKYNPMRSHSIARISLAVIVVIILTLVLVAYANHADAKGNTIAQILLPDGTLINGFVNREFKYRNSAGVVDVEIDGKIYTTHFSNVVLISE